MTNLSLDRLKEVAGVFISESIFQVIQLEYADYLKENNLTDTESNCQTADYLGRFPQIISDGNTCHSLRSMRQKHILSGVTADYRGLISVQLWLD